MKLSPLVILGIFIFLLSACKRTAISDFSISGFSPIINYQPGNKQKNISFDYYNAIRDGFIIPTARQVKEGKFAFTFSVKNNGKEPRKFYYKIYYQNEGYKFPEDHELANENFYGSWEQAGREFAETDVIPADGKKYTITDSIRIVGNPRDEQKYYGYQENVMITDEILKEYIGKVYNNATWQEQIRKKAEEQGVPFEIMVKRDAAYALEQDRFHSEPENFRWKRNPRVGEYSFMLVVTTEEGLKEIPAYIKNVAAKKDSVFVNPYSYFLHGDGAELDNTIITKSEPVLKAIANPNLGQGVFIDRMRYPDADSNWIYTTPLCNSSENMYYHAPFQQYIHWIDTNAKMVNIPLVADVNEYTREEYNQNKKGNSFVLTPIKVSECPCKTLSSDSSGRKLILRNPATKEGEWRKENVGVISRHGFTYGKYTIKIKMPELLNKDQVWNGLTNAIWLIYQAGTWNTRRSCDDVLGGYIPKNQSGKDAQKQRIVNYSEIDFEIVKSARHWPKSSYPQGTKVPDESIADSSNIFVTCTNWDMACQQPSNYGVGVHSIEHNGTKYDMHRWDHWYQALTGKYAASDDELFKGEFYYFQIDWRPTEIIWRIGPSKDKLREVAYMDETVTSIPNNQMLMIITQEYHLANWWPNAPFSQDHIPFPAKDIIGEVYELEIE